MLILDRGRAIGEVEICLFLVKVLNQCIFATRLENVICLFADTKKVFLMDGDVYGTKHYPCGW